MEVRKVAEQVKLILEQHPKTRDDDFLLYGFVLNNYGYSMKTDFITIAKSVHKKEIPSMETVGRTRRKAQELYPELRGKVYNERNNRTEEFIDFSRDESI